MCEDALEDIVGVVVGIRVSGEGLLSYSVYKYIFPADPAIVQPSEHMVDTMLLAEGLRLGGPLAKVGALYSPNTSLVLKIKEGMTWTLGKDATGRHC